MQLKNIPVFTALHNKNMPDLIYKSRFIIAIAFAVVLLLSGCSKNPITAIINQTSQSLLQQYFEDNILNRDFKVALATDSSANLTAQYSNYTFRLVKSTLLTGPLTATNGTVTYSGTWTCNDDYSKLVIALPNSVAEFSFLSREWRFTKKAVPTMELAPWGSTEPKVLHMERL
jgi:hypothetical protein